MVEFNPDGSIKLPDKLAHHKARQENLMKDVKCIKVRKEVVSTKPPKSCVLHFVLSDRVTDDRFVDTIYSGWSGESDTPSKFIREGPKEFRVEIGTNFRRCTDCTALIRRYHNFVRNMIENDGNCSYRQKVQSRFSYEDYFD